MTKQRGVVMMSDKVKRIIAIVICGLLVLSCVVPIAFF